MKKLIGALLAASLVAGCASFLDHVDTAAGVAAGAVCLPAGPEAAILCHAGAEAAVDAIVEGNSKASIDQVETPTQAVTYLLSDVIHWIIGGTILLTIIAWLLPGQQRVYDLFKRNKTNENRNTRPAPKTGSRESDYY